MHCSNDHDSAKLLLMLPLVLVLLVLAFNWPEIQRYLRIKSM